MRIGILETGRLPETIEATYGDYPALMADWLRPAMPEATFTGIPVIDGELPGKASEFDGYVITGSKHGVYDELPWIESLKQFIRQAAKAEVPQVGICFGHQIAAAALGGHAEKSARGWGVGRQTYAVSLGDGAAEIGMIVFHQDQVLSLPDDAQVIGGNGFCPIGVVRYAQPVATAQFHPEFTVPFTRELLDVRAVGTLPADIVASARLSLARTPENARFGRWAARFLLGR